MPSPPYDLIIIGGGAAGHYAAASVGEALLGSGKKANILLLEKTSHVLAKVKISGGGRCNVTHDCDAPRPLVDHYPRGHRSLPGPFSRFGTRDTIAWFENHGVQLKTESDGRIFPVTDSSQTVIDCLTRAVQDAGVETRLGYAIDSVEFQDHHFHLKTKHGENFTTRYCLLATGGTRLASSAKLAQDLGHQLKPAIPSLFSFDIPDPALRELSGLSVAHAALKLPGSKIKSEGPLLVTHRGLSGPAALKLSAWTAEFCHEKNYHFDIEIDWIPDAVAEKILTESRNKWPKRQVSRHSPHDAIPRRLWEYFCHKIGVEKETTWSHLPKDMARKLADILKKSRYEVTGQSTNKDEFVTCGGVPLKEINLTRMESKIRPGLFFAGEIMDVDGVTGGFNFQNAWTSGHLAGVAIAQEILRLS